MEKNFIEKNIESENNLVRILYTDLQERIQSYEEDGSAVERIKLLDAVSAVIIVGCFGAYLFTLFI